MNAVSKVEADTEAEIIPFNSYAAWLEEREETARLRDIIQRSLILLRMECDRRAGLGEDVSHIRSFIAGVQL